MAARGPVVAMKLGADGGLVVAREAASRVDAPQVEVVDTIGAGDAFDAGFLAGWLDGRSPEDCLRLAVACGALSVRASRRDRRPARARTRRRSSRRGSSRDAMRIPSPSRAAA